MSVIAAAAPLPVAALDPLECDLQARYLDTFLFDARQSLEIFERQPPYQTTAVTPEAKAAGEHAVDTWREAAEAMTAYVQALEDTAYLLRVCARTQ